MLKRLLLASALLLSIGAAANAACRVDVPVSCSTALVEIWLLASISDCAFIEWVGTHPFAQEAHVLPLVG
jgi:hypothetical protein